MLLFDSVGKPAIIQFKKEAAGFIECVLMMHFAPWPHFVYHCLSHLMSSACTWRGEYLAAHSGHAQLLTVAPVRPQWLRLLVHKGFEVIPYGVYWCLTGLPPFCVDVCKKVGKRLNLCHLLPCGDGALGKQGDVLLHQSQLKCVEELGHPALCAALQAAMLMFTGVFATSSAPRYTGHSCTN